MTKVELITKVAEKSDISKSQTTATINAFLDIIQDEMIAGNKLTLTGFGTFTMSERSARIGRNPRSGEPIKIPACKVVKFKPGNILKDAVK